MTFDTANRGFVFGLVQAAIMMWAAIGCAASADCPKFLAGHKVGTVESPLITEASGLVASRKNPGVLWVHNDKGPPCVYAVTPQGKYLGTYNLVAPAITTGRILPSARGLSRTWIIFISAT